MHQITASLLLASVLTLGPAARRNEPAPAVALPAPAHFTYYVKSDLRAPEVDSNQFHVLREIGPRAGMLRAKGEEASDSVLNDSALSEWARREPPAAAAWALRQPEHLRLAAVSAVLIGVADDPATGVKLTRWFCANDPTFVREHGRTLIAVLCAEGEFRAGLRFAELGGPERPAWMGLVLAEWSRTDPAAALAAAVAVDEAGPEPDAVP